MKMDLLKLAMWVIRATISVVLIALTAFLLTQFYASTDILAQALDSSPNGVRLYETVITVVVFVALVWTVALVWEWRR